MGLGSGCAKLCVIIFGFYVLYLIISLTHPSLKKYTPPSCSIKDVYIPALNTRLPMFNSSAPAATFIFFDLQLDNNIKDDDVHYEYTNPALAFYYAPNTNLIANYSVPQFSQGSEEKAHLRDLVETQGMPWSDALAAVSGGSTVAFTVEFSATVKVKGHEGRELLLRADLEVNDSGEKLRKKNIKLLPFVNSISTTLTSLSSHDALINDVYSV